MDADIMARMAAGIVAITAAGAGAAKAIVWTGRIVRKTGRLADDLLGEPERPGYPAQPGLMARVSAIEAQLQPNSGSSLRDRVDRVGRLVEAHLADPRAHEMGPRTKHGG